MPKRDDNHRTGLQSSAVQIWTCGSTDTGKVRTNGFWRRRNTQGRLQAWGYAGADSKTSLRPFQRTLRPKRTEHYLLPSATVPGPAFSDRLQSPSDLISNQQWTHIHTLSKQTIHQQSTPTSIPTPELACCLAITTIAGRTGAGHGSLDTAFHFPQDQNQAGNRNQMLSRCLCYKVEREYSRSQCNTP